MALQNTTEKEREISRITTALTKAIAQQRIAPGTRLIEAQLVDTFKANRNHVRVALQRLSLKKIITILPNRGATIAEPSIEEAREVFSARSVIELGVIELLVQRIDSQIIKRLKQQLRLEQKAIDSHIREDIITMSGNFHLLLAELSGNTVLADVLKNLITRSSLILALYQRNDTPQCGCEDHQLLIDILERGDTQAAVQKMKNHLQHIEADLNLDFWKNKKVNLTEALLAVDSR